MCTLQRQEGVGKVTNVRCAQHCMYSTVRMYACMYVYSTVRALRRSRLVNGPAMMVI